MNDRTVVERVAEQQPPRKPYRPPQLTLFGHVAAFTQSTVCSANSDSGCAVGGSGMGMTAPSDRRLKESIVRIGDHPLGFGLYLFEYKPEVRDRCGHGVRFGVMADEVETVVPEAVIVDDTGFKSVRYDLLGIRVH
jgi:hypothetical protein